VTLLSALDLLRHPGELALALVASAVGLAAFGWLAHKTIDGSRKDG
jgi:hypothetical protein